MTALIDTGASISLLDEKLISQLRLVRYGEVGLLFPGEEKPVARATFLSAMAFATSYAADSFVDWPDFWEVAPFTPGTRPFRAVLGMDVLSKGDFTLMRRGTVSFDFSPF